MGEAATRDIRGKKQSDVVIAVAVANGWDARENLDKENALVR